MVSGDDEVYTALQKKLKAANGTDGTETEEATVNNGFPTPPTPAATTPQSGFLDTPTPATASAPGTPVVDTTFPTVGETPTPPVTPASTALVGSPSTTTNDWVQQLFKRGSQPLTADDPTLKAQFDPVSGEMQRAAQRTRAAAAERATYQGTNIGGAGGGLDGEMNSINEDLAGKQGGLMAQLVGQELQGRRQDIVNAIQGAQGEERMQLQSQLDELDRQMADKHFYDTMGFDVGKAQSDDDYRRLQLILSGGN